MDTGLLAGIISAVATLSGALATVIVTIIKYNQAKKNEKEAVNKEFYLYTAYNTVIEAERLFGDGNGAEKKKYSLIKIQNEAMNSGIEWDPKLASKCIEQAVALRNDYKTKGEDFDIEEVIRLEVETEMAEAREEVEAAKTDIAKGILSGLRKVNKTAKKINNNLEVKQETTQGNTITIVDEE